MILEIDCPRCNGGTLKVNVPSGYKVITDGRPSKLPLKKICKNCNRGIKYTVVKEADYETMLAYVQKKDN
jgi:hypothetical protein